jgi:hypothetical protein
LGGRLRPVPELGLPLRLAAGAMPSRWAFEGLLLMEADAVSTAPVSADLADVPADVAEPYFPAARERMGAMADALALGFMVIGLAATAAFILGPSRPPP